MNATDIPKGGALASPEALTGLCSNELPETGTAALLDKVNALMPGLNFRHVMTRSGWYRFGGVVDADHGRVAGNIVQWIEQESGGNLEELAARFADKGYVATRLVGKTHFLTAPRGSAPEDFVQIEIEELCETLDRPLFDHDCFPDTLEEFLDPLDCARLEPKAVAPAHYQFRRITAIKELLEHSGEGRQADNLRRLFRDWRDSSAAEPALFCEHWVLALREHTSRDGLPQVTARPVSTYAGELPELPQGERLKGVELANAIHGYDRRLGYPFAWYFMLLAQTSANYALADAVLADQAGDYDYLPARDLTVLCDWEKVPYGV